MSKTERVSTLLMIAGLAIALLAWLFPQNETKTTFISLGNSRSSFKPVESVQTEAYQEAPGSQGHNAVEDRVAPLIRSISFSTFFSQLGSAGLDSGKIEYITDSRHLLTQKLEFRELLLILREVSLDSNKLEVVTLLRGHVNAPSELELELYGSEFSLSSNRRAAFKLLAGN